MPEVTFDVEVQCICGKSLSGQSSANKWGDTIIVEPCEECLNNARDEAYNEGYKDGQEDRKREAR